jgi:hypothetical protein
MALSLIFAGFRNVTVLLFLSVSVLINANHLQRSGIQETILTENGNASIAN